VLRWHKRKFSPFGEKCRIGDVVGCGLDVENHRVLYWLNGRPLGVAFDRVKVRDGLYPGMSTEAQERFTFNFGATPFRYPPPFRASSYFSNTPEPCDDSSSYVFKNWSPLHMTLLDVPPSMLTLSYKGSQPQQPQQQQQLYLHPIDENEKSLLSRVDSFEGCTALHLCAYLGRVKQVEQIIKRQQDLNMTAADAIDCRDALHRTPFILAALGSADLTVLSLLLRAGASITAEDKYGRNALHYCAGSGNLEAAHKLLEVIPSIP